MLPSHEIYHRIIWDKRLDPTVFIIGYQDRLSSSGIREKKLVDWDANGDIPWHRVRYIRCLNAMVWSRDEHIDLFSSGELPKDAWQEIINTNQTIEKTLATFSPQPTYYYQLNSWQSFEQIQPNVLVKELKIITFNVLSDLYEADKIYTAERIPLIIKYLAEAKADIIVLQEVTETLFQALLKEPWLEKYYCSEPPTAPSLQSQGLVIFASIPFTLTDHWFSNYKRVLLASWQINNNPLHLAAVHLTSSHTNNSEQIRAKQLDTLLNYLDSMAGDVVIAGDFNLVADEHEQDFLFYSFKDLWQELHPKELGYTFNPELNPLAKIMSSSGRLARFDRILLRSKQNNWKAENINLFAYEPTISAKGERLFASDHFGVLAKLKNNAIELLRSVAPIYQSAIVIIPPKELWEKIQPIRKLYDKKVDRWMPHITLIYGFLPVEHFALAAQVISQTLKELSPFKVTLTKYGTFSHRNNSTAWLEPVSEPANALHKLQSLLAKIFPQCDEQSKKSNGFTPHLSVGQFDSPATAMKKLPTWQEVDFLVDRVAVIHRQGNQPFEVICEATLGQNNIQTESKNTSLITLIEKLNPSLTLDHKQRQESVLSIIKQACEECLGDAVLLYLIGSAHLGVQTQASDVDIICIIPTSITGQDFLLQVKEKLAGIYQKARIVGNAQVPIIKMEIDGIQIDLLYAHSTKFPFLAPLTSASQKYFDPTSWQTIVGVLEIEILLEIVSQHIDLELFRQLLKAVKTWVKQRAILGNAWGFPPSFSWTVLAAWSCTKLDNKENLSLEKLLENFFELLSKHNWQQAIALTESGRNYQVTLPKDWLPIITSIKPNQNTARNISRSTAKVVKQEILQARQIFEKIKLGNLTWENLLAKVDIQKDFEKILLLTMKAKNSNDLELCAGWLEGNIFGLILNLEQELNIDLRPYTQIKKQQTTCQIVIAVNLLEEKDLARLEKITNNFINNFTQEKLTSQPAELKIDYCTKEKLVNW